MAATGDSVDAQGWLVEFDSGLARIGGRFGRVEPRRQARAFLPVVRCGHPIVLQPAEQTGDASPHRMQRLLGEACSRAALKILLRRRRVPERIPGQQPQQAI
ncbi:hypothetical protein GCM10027610_024170 [Dactylosporangium cerinum]